VEAQLVSGAARETVSVVIPAYRAAATIGRAVDSVLSQTRPADEILVIDDGSPDDLAAALAPYGGRVRLVRQANGGAASARNHGLDLATGGLIAFLDADDYWEPHKLARQLAVLESHPEVGVVTSWFYQQPPGRSRFLTAPPPLPVDRVLRVGGGDVLTAARCIWTSALLVRRGVLGGQRFDTTLATAEDVDLWIRLLRSAPLYLISEPLATAVMTAGSLSRSDVAADAANMLRVVHRYSRELGRVRLWSWEARVYREWAAAHLGNGRPREAVRPAFQRLLRQPWSAEGWWVLLKALAWPGDVRLAGAGRRVLSSE
jgi:glycosyltransferase involved in cell wall biosynthesis